MSQICGYIGKNGVSCVIISKFWWYWDNNFLLLCHWIHQLTRLLYWQHHSNWDAHNSTLSEESDLSSPALIECRDVYKSFGDKEILRGANFKVKGSQCTLCFYNFSLIFNAFCVHFFLLRVLCGIWFFQSRATFVFLMVLIYLSKYWQILCASSKRFTMVRLLASLDLLAQGNLRSYA